MPDASKSKVKGYSSAYSQSHTTPTLKACFRQGSQTPRRDDTAGHCPAAGAYEDKGDEETT